MANTLKLPVGIENFEEIRNLGFYYIDKTRLIEQLLQGWGKAVSYTHLDVYKRQHNNFCVENTASKDSKYMRCDL